jgi:hypothetical protein
MFSKICLLSYQFLPIGYHLLNQSQEWLFPLKNFPGIPVACVNELPSRAVLEAAKRLNFHQLKILSSLWLSLNCPAEILEQIHNNSEIETHLRTRFNYSEYLESEDYFPTDLEAAWKAFTRTFIWLHFPAKKCLTLDCDIYKL